MSQLQHKDVDFKAKRFPLILLLDGLASPANIGGLFRLAEAFGVEKIILHNCDFNSNSTRFKRTARQTQEHVSFEIETNTLRLLEHLKKEAYQLIALEVTDISIPVQRLFLEPGIKIVLVVGNERQGVSEDFLKHSKKQVHIPMYGSNSSMNVAQATGIALFEITKYLTGEPIPL